MPEQNLKNHTRVVPMFHIGVFIPLLMNLVWTAYQLFANFSGQAIVQILVAIALILMALSLRTQVLTVQDRVIRLEMRLRLMRLLGADQQATIGGLTHKQLVALRFASDAELPGLVGQVIAGQLRTQREIK